MLLDLSLIFAFSLLLVKATDWIVAGLRYFSRTTGVGKYAITGIIMGLATSLPEFSVAVAAVLEGNPNLVLGNIIGSNIADLSIIVGLGAVIGGSVFAHDKFVKHDAFYAFLAGALPMLLLIDGRLGLGDGLALIGVYLVYNTTILREHRRKLINGPPGRPDIVHRIISRLGDSATEKHLGWLVVGIITMMVAAEGIVKSAVSLAAGLHLPVLLVGLFMVAVGTSLPELFFQIRALRLGETGMVLGNLIGSVVANATLILGITAAIRPIVLVNGLRSYLTATLAYIVIFTVFYLFIRTKRRLDRWEGAALVGLYILFVVIELKI
jgi:cation:H+ antiporter